jgi:hypothetical protein
MTHAPPPLPDLAQRLLEGWERRRIDAPEESFDKMGQRLAQFCAHAAWVPASELIARGALADSAKTRSTSELLGIKRPALALQMIAKGQAPDLLRQALAQGAKAKAVTQTLSCPPIFLALSNLDEASARVLLEAGANPNAQALDWPHFAADSPRPLKRSPLTAVCSLASRVIGYGLPGSHWPAEWDALRGMSFEQIMRQALACCETLIEFGADVDAPDEARETPLCMAAAGDLPELVGALIRAGARADAPGFSKQGFVGHVAHHHHEGWLGGGSPQERGKLGPVEAALVQHADKGLAALIDAGVAFTDEHRASIGQMALASREFGKNFWQLRPAPPTKPCPWMGALAQLEARDLRACVNGQISASSAPASRL